MGIWDHARDDDFANIKPFFLGFQLSFFCLARCNEQVGLLGTGIAFKIAQSNILFDIYETFWLPNVTIITNRHHPLLIANKIAFLKN